MANKQHLQKRLDNVKIKYERLLKKTYPSDRVSEFFHLGTVGGSGKSVQKLNRQRDRDLDRRIDDAKEIIRLQGMISDLERRIRNADKPIVKVTKPRKVSKPRPPKSFPSAEYLDWANALGDDMEKRIEAARAKMHGIQRDDPHDHYLRGEIAAYVEIQAELIGEHFRGNQTTIAQLLESLDKLADKKHGELEQNPTSRYLPEFCKGLAVGIEIIQSQWRQNSL